MTSLASKSHPWTGSRWYAGLWMAVAAILVVAYASDPDSLIKGFFALAAVLHLIAQLRAGREARLTAE
jgi:hypothetical protein